MKTLKIAAFAGFAAIVAACETGTPYGSVGGGRVEVTTGSALAASLGGADRAAMERAFVSAIEEGATGKPVAWRGAGASGTVTPGAHLVANLRPNPQTTLPVAAPLLFSDPLQTEQGLHAVRATANLRAGPSTEAAIIGRLDAGAPVDGVGKVSGKPWMLVASGGTVRGYVHESLIMKAPGDGLDLAGGPTRRAHRCRAFEQQLAAGGRQDRWTGVACDRGSGWRIEPPPRTS